MHTKLKVGGREAPNGKLEQAIEYAALVKVKEQMNAKAAAIHCPEHNEIPRLMFDGATLGSLKVRVQACCDACRGLAVAAMSAK